MHQRLVLLALILMMAAADGLSQPRRRPVRRTSIPPPTVVISDDFRQGQLGWEPGFADFSPTQGDMELEAGIRPLPSELGVSGTGFFLAGHNRSDDLFMFLSKKLTAADGIRPNQQYEVSFRIIFASRAGEECGGIGGSPGSSVYLKAGASAEPPLVILSSDGHYRLTLDKGNQMEGGPAASVAGTIANGTPNCSQDAPFVSLERSHRHSFLVRANPFGEIWLLVGTDSGFEGKTELFYQSIFATFTPVS